MSLFNRVIKVDIGPGGSGISIEKLRVYFDVTKTTRVSANMATLRIWNMAANSRNQIRELDHQAVIRAGYSEDVGAKMIFKGEITSIDHSIQIPEVITSIQCGDGIKPLREIRGSFSFKEGTTAREILKAMAAKMDLTIRQWPDIPAHQYAQGFSYSGDVKAGISKVADRAGLEWSIQNNELQFLKKRAVIASVPRVINYRNGLLESPSRLHDLTEHLIKEQPKPGFKVRTLLNPDIEPGSSVTLESDVVSGEFRVEKLTHSGDTYSDIWETIMEIVEI